MEKYPAGQLAGDLSYRMLRTTWRELETGLRDGLRHRRVAKAAGKRLLPVPTATAPAFDAT